MSAAVAEAVSPRTLELLRSGIVWDNHACMPLRPGDVDFLPQLERARRSGIDVISLNVSFDVVDSNDAFKMLATFRHWVRRHGEHCVLADTVADIEAAKASGKLAVVFDIEGGNAVAAHPGLVEVFYRLGVRWMLFAYNKNNKLGGGCMDDDAADLPIASVPAAEIAEPLESKNDLSPLAETREAIPSEEIWDILRRLVGQLMAERNARLSLECLALVSGLSFLGDSMSAVARRHSVTRAAVSKRCVELTKHLNLLPSRAMRSLTARRAYRAAQLSTRTEYERFGNAHS